jgi:DNA-directed RNA polymerase specialized sigma24 family protein
MSYREIAEITKRSEKAVDNAVQRIRRKFENLPQGDISSS